MNAKLENQRIELQVNLDKKKTLNERNNMGQFATPPDLAHDILAYTKQYFSKNQKIKFLDPAFGTGSFYSALIQMMPKNQIKSAVGFEIDPHYGKPAISLWKKTDLQLAIGDFTRQAPIDLFNLLICNPPYVRHHHLKSDEKKFLQKRIFKTSEIKISGLAGLYCYFLGLSHEWLEKGALSGWLIPSEFMDVNYGRAIKQYLLEKVTLIHIHRFDPNDVQFKDALVSSAVVWFKNELPPEEHEVQFSFGGKLTSPKIIKKIPSKVLSNEHKWTRFPMSNVRKKPNSNTLADFFEIKRGIATGANKYFILSQEKIIKHKLPMDCFKPILPSPRNLKVDEIFSDDTGNPIIENKLFLLDPIYKDSEIKNKSPALWNYLKEGERQKINKGYLCAHRSRWYIQEQRLPAPIYCTYLGRGDIKDKKPFRFILNHSKAIIANVYLAMYPTELLMKSLKNNPALIYDIWRILNRLAPNKLLGEGRVYGGGLYKLEPKELANVSVSEISQLLTDPKYLVSSEKFAAE